MTPYFPKNIISRKVPCKHWSKTSPWTHIAGKCLHGAFRDIIFSGNKCSTPETSHSCHVRYVGNPLLIKEKLNVRAKLHSREEESERANGFKCQALAEGHEIESHWEPFPSYTTSQFLNYLKVLK